ncbi:MAG: hypothetical protein Q9195_005427 [Heterodermia aff. obscurata]
MVSITDSLSIVSDEEVSWNFDETEETRLTTLICVTPIQQQQGRPLITTPDNSCDDEIDDSTSNAPTDAVELIARSGSDKLKERYLNPIVKIFSRTKEPINSVSCIAMREEEDCITVFVARSIEFEKIGEEFSQDFAVCLRTIHDHEIYEIQLWELLMTFHKSRIAFHAKEFLENPQNRDHQGSASSIENETLKTLLALRNACERLQRGEILLCGSIVENAYMLARVNDIQTCAGRVFKNSQTTQNLLYDLGNLKAIFETMLRSVKQCPSLFKVTFAHIPEYQKRPRPSTNLVQALGSTIAYLKVHGMTLPLCRNRISAK